MAPEFVRKEAMRERILVFGGSFDPPHQGHRALVEAAKEKIHPDRTIIIPSYHSPWKNKSWALPEDRFQMAKLAFPGAEISRVEMLAGRLVYTVDVLGRLKKENPDSEIHFVVGSDLALRFKEWKNPPRLRELAHWWTAARPPFQGRIPRFFNVISSAMPEISSTDLRVGFLMGEDRSREVSPAALKRILKRGLYGTTIIPALGKILKAERLTHTISVATLARKLAPIWGIDSFEAALAGLLHDAGRSVPISGMKSYCQKRRLRVPLFREISAYQPILLHAYISEDLSKRMFEIKTPEVLKAIRNHTLGAFNMGDLERLIYVSDACSEDRKYSEAAKLRKLAEKDPSRAFSECLNGKIRHAVSLQGWIHPLPIQLWNSIIL